MAEVKRLKSVDTDAATHIDKYLNNHTEFGPPRFNMRIHDTDENEE